MKTHASSEARGGGIRKYLAGLVIQSAIGGSGHAERNAWTASPMLHSPMLPVHAAPDGFHVEPLLRTSAALLPDTASSPSL